MIAKRRSPPVNGPSNLQFHVLLNLSFLAAWLYGRHHQHPQRCLHKWLMAAELSLHSMTYVDTNWLIYGTVPWESTFRPHNNIILHRVHTSNSWLMTCWINFILQHSKLNWAQTWPSPTPHQLLLSLSHIHCFTRPHSPINRSIYLSLPSLLLYGVGV